MASFEIYKISFVALIKLLGRYNTVLSLERKNPFTITIRTKNERMRGAGIFDMLQSELITSSKVWQNYIEQVVNSTVRQNASKM